MYRKHIAAYQEMANGTARLHAATGTLPILAKSSNP